MINWKDPAVLDRVKQYFASNPEAAFVDCAQVLGVSKNALISAAHRHGWHAELDLPKGHGRRMPREERERLAAERQRAERLAAAARLERIRATAQTPPQRRRAVTREDMKSWSRRAAEAIAAGEISVTVCRPGHAYGAYRGAALSVDLMGRMR